jgi:hypothetical protein
VTTQMNIELRATQLYSNEKMPPASLAGTVNESKAKRQERLISRFRDRGGCVSVLLKASLASEPL